MPKISTIRWGIILIGVGLILLADNLGYVGSYVWVELLALWPVLLIAIGIELAFKKSQMKMLALLSPLIILIAFIYAISASWTNDSYESYRIFSKHSSKTTKLQLEEFTVGSDSDIKSLDVEIDFGVGELWLGPSSDKLFDGDFEYRRRKPLCRYDSDGDEGRVRIQTKDMTRFNFFDRKQYKNDARIFIADYIPLNLDIDIGAADIELDLSELMVTDLILDSGAAKVDLKIGCRAEDVKIDLDTGASLIRLLVPHEMGLKIDADIALTSTNFRSMDLEKRGGNYYSDNYDTCQCRAEIGIDSGVSRIELDYY
jgi:hypothetical protein